MDRTGSAAAGVEDITRIGDGGIPVAEVHHQVGNAIVVEGSGKSEGPPVGRPCRLIGLVDRGPAGRRPLPGGRGLRTEAGVLHPDGEVVQRLVRDGLYIQGQGKNIAGMADLGGQIDRLDAVSKIIGWEEPTRIAGSGAKGRGGEGTVSVAIDVPTVSVTIMADRAVLPDGDIRVVAVRTVDAGVVVADAVPGIAIVVRAGGAGVPGVGIVVVAVRAVDAGVVVAQLVPAVGVAVHAGGAGIPDIGVQVIAVGTVDAESKADIENITP